MNVPEATGDGSTLGQVGRAMPITTAERIVCWFGLALAILIGVAVVFYHHTRESSEDSRTSIEVSHVER